jgi:hypothetical protein
MAGYPINRLYYCKLRIPPFAHLAMHGTEQSHSRPKRFPAVFLINCNAVAFTFNLSLQTMKQLARSIGWSVLAGTLLVFSTGLGFSLRHCLHSGTTVAQLALLAEAPPCAAQHNYHGASATGIPISLPSCCRNVSLTPSCCSTGDVSGCPSKSPNGIHLPCCDVEFLLFQLADFGVVTPDSGYITTGLVALPTFKHRATECWSATAPTKAPSPPYPPPALNTGRRILLCGSLLRI